MTESSVFDLPANMRSKVTLHLESYCWIWSGAVNSRGYGCVSVKGKSHLAHRFAYQMLVGPIADGMTIDHICEIKRCINPAHLQQMERGLNVQMVGVREQARREAERPAVMLGPDPLAFYMHQILNEWSAELAQLSEASS
jgi:hypothetical protein